MFYSRVFMKIAVTGGSGFVGLNLIKELKEGHEVVNLDIVNPAESDHFIKCDITNREEVSRIFKNELQDADAVVHLAALSKEAASNETPSIDFNVNINGTFNILNACLNTGVKNFIFASSYLVYGNSDFEKVSETSPLHPKSIYAATKASGEAIINSFHNIYGINTVLLRKCVLYGENDPQKRVINLFIDRVKEGKDITVFGDKFLDFLYIRDAVNAYIKAINHKKSDTFNVGSGTGHSLKEVAETIVERLKSNSKIIEAPAREGEVDKYVADISKARKLLGFEPTKNVMQFIESQCE